MRGAGELPVSVSEYNLPSRGREVPSDPLSDWYLALPSKLEPKQVESILRQALAGSVWQQTQLTNRMLESWPMFKKCAMEVRDAVADANYVVHASAAPGKKPTPQAQEKADLVRRAKEGFNTDRFADEEGWRGMVYDLSGAILDGAAVCELLWDTNAEDHSGRREFRPRAACYVTPRRYAPQPDGSLSVADDSADGWLSFPTQANRAPQKRNPHKFMVAKYKSKSGSWLGSGLMRTLAYYWVTVVYGRDFMLSFAQKYGNPFLDIAYQSGIPQTEIDKFETLARRAANQGWCVHPNTGTIAVTPAQSLGGSNAQVELMRTADTACQLVMLGQTLTSSTPELGGTRAQGQVHEGVRQDKLEAYTGWMADVLTEQFSESVVWVNYRECADRPTMKADLTAPLTPEQKTALITAASGSRMPLPVEPLYKKLDLEVPQAGDEVLQDGRVKVMGEALTDEEHFAQQLDQQVAQAEASMALQQPVQAGGSRAVRLDIIRSATDRELAELEELVVAAERAPHLNGEAAAVLAKLETIGRRTSL